jgi:lactoylglutathione lyase
MRLLKEFNLPEYKLDLYFLGYGIHFLDSLAQRLCRLIVLDSPDSVSYGKDHTDREGVIELAHCHDTVESSHQESNNNNNNNNNEGSRSFGHVCLSVDSIQEACQRLSSAGYKLQENQEDNFSGQIAFALDPDNYRVAMIGQSPFNQIESLVVTDPQFYRMHHTLLYVKNLDASIKFYTDVMGMNLRQSPDSTGLGRNLCFLGYGHSTTSDFADGASPFTTCEGLLGLACEGKPVEQDGGSDHDGNAEPQGFGHIAISVDCLETACKRLDGQGVRWQKRLLEGSFRIAFVLDPDDYVRYFLVLHNPPGRELLRPHLPLSDRPSAPFLHE